ncbi:MAG: prepilin-type N-terminal cleavage/methylation domain-containing protein [Betaproteobacteria bacterium]|nr:MAG: prepilin-type N-terminal cleavage/methylation domain-containing protein [Betaproteobacteria bacterium]
MTATLGKYAGGFSLIELSVAIIVIALLLGSLLVPLSTQVDQRRYAETEKQLEHVREAVIGFALANRYLPCPAVSATDGREDRDTGTGQCTDVGGSPKRDGFLPWVTLGVTPSDAWNNLIRYSVDPDFARSDPNFFFTLASLGDIRVRTRDQGGTLVDLTNVEIPAVILSHGENGFGATSSAGVARTVPGGWTGDESDNASNTTLFYFRTRSEVATVTGGEFDDVVTWVSLNQLFARMVSAGRLP